MGCLSRSPFISIRGPWQAMTVHDDEDMTEFMFEGFNDAWQDLAKMLDGTGASSLVHERIRAWLESTLIPWIDRRKEALLREMAGRMRDMERAIERIDKALPGT